MSKLEVAYLQKVKNLLITKKWTKKVFAKKANGRTSCNIQDPAASCFCIRGALERVLYDNAKFEKVNNKAISDLLVNVPYGAGLVQFNDSAETTKKDVLNLIDRTIEYIKNK